MLRRESADIDENFCPSSLKSPSIGCLVCHKVSKAITDTESGEIICSGCGVVFTEYSEEHHDERSISASHHMKDKIIPTNPFSSYNNTGAMTEIGRTNKDFSGHELNVAMRSTFERLRTWDKRMRLHGSRSKYGMSNNASLWKIFYRLGILKARLGLPSIIVEKAAYIYRKAQQRKLVSGGRTISAVLAAAVYITCREIGTPRPLNEIAKVSDIKRKDIARNYRILIKELDLQVPIIDPMKCIIRVANTVEINERTKRHALKIMDEAISKEIPAGKDPMGLSGAIVYAVCKKAGQDITQADIAKAAGTTHVTIRKRFRELEGIL
jgi:transcription initiation factor TFIIB